MSALTDRGKRFRAAIAAFIEARRAGKEKKGKDYDPRTYAYDTWLADAASRAYNLQVVTHPIKFTHSAINGASSIHVGATASFTHDEIGSHSIESLEEDFAISDAKHLDVYSLLKETVDGKRLLDWLRDDDADFARALNDDSAKADKLMSDFRCVLKSDEKIISHALAKQIYWLAGENPLEDGCFHLLQPMFSSSLEHVVNEDIRKVREGMFAARGTSKQKATFAGHATYPDLLCRVFGGSNAQNVSPQNKVRGGKNYLLPSLPPPAWRPSGVNLLKQESAFDGLIWFGDMRELVKALIDLLEIDPAPTMETRKHREIIEQGIGQELARFGAAIRSQYQAGWTRDNACSLPRCEQLWLDPDRTELPTRDAPEHPQWRADDEAFVADYELGNWPDQVAERFGNWLNARLHAAGLVNVSLPERNHWAGEAVLDVAWPVPLQRRATGAAP